MKLVKNHRCGANDLYQAYRTWACSNGEYIRRLKDFTDALSDRGFKKIKPNNRKTWLGLRLADLEFTTPWLRTLCLIYTTNH